VAVLVAVAAVVSAADPVAGVVLDAVLPLAVAVVSAAVEDPLALVVVS
jgi:hypothetical protein